MPTRLSPLGLAALLGLLCAAPAPAPAFCGFFVSGAQAELTNNASQVVLMRKGNRTVLTMSNNYQGPPQDFAMVVPVPTVLQKEQVKALAPDVFSHIDQLSAPRLVEYWEQDPCAPRYKEEKAKKNGVKRRASVDKDDGEGDSLGVKVEARFAVGEYQIVILSAKDSGGLETWLRHNRYNIPKGAAAALAPYIRDQMKFFVAKVDIQKVRRDSHGLVVLSPLRFHYEASELRLPVRLGLLNARGQQDLVIYVLHPDHRFEVANYPNLFIPTNIEVADAVRRGFPAFYAELFDETLRRNQNQGVVTEYAWQTTSCDPCPTPPLSAQDTMTLGEDVLSTPADGLPRKGRKIGGGGFFGAGSPWVLTRLHTRYDQATLSADLIFREARPVTGGRANWDGTPGDQGAQVQPGDGGVNNFQGRYIIRHYWEGAVACQNPQFGLWGGPPDGGASRPQAAQDLANAARGKVALRDVIQSAVPSLGLAGKPRPQRPGEKR